MNIWLYEDYITIRNYEIDFFIRRQGIGSGFYDIIEQYIKSCGYNKIVLHLVLTCAEKFWTKKGFNKINGLPWMKNI